jgi:two-component sensor histidine kinase
LWKSCTIASKYAGEGQRHRFAEPATATDLEHGQQAIESRLLALGRAHDLLLQAQWSSASLAHIVQGATEPYDSQGEGGISIQGADLGIVSGAVIALAMTLNELCTDTTKFGALSVPAGRVEIASTIDPNNERLDFFWTEKGRSGGEGADPAKFRNPADRDACQPAQRHGRIGL